MMATRSFLCLFVLVAGFANVRSDDTSCVCEKEMTIDAAFSFTLGSNFMTYFITGDNVHIFQDYSFVSIVTHDRINIPQDDAIQAIYVPPNQSERRIVYGKDSIYYSYVSSANIRLTKVRYGKKRAFIEHGGPDAIGVLNGDVYVLKGCHFAIRRRWNDWSEPRNISDVFHGVPCHIDAAWDDENGKLNFVKGDQLWTSGEDFMVEGPRDMASVFTFRNNWVLKPARDATGSN